LKIGLVNKLQFIFDLDGTLLDSEKGILDSLRFSINKHAPIYLPKIHKGLIGPPISKILKKIIISDHLIEVISLEFRRHYDDSADLKTGLFPGVYDGLKELKNKNKLFVSTNKPLIPTKKILHKLNIDDCFFKIYSSGSKGFKSKKEIVNNVLSNSNDFKSIVIGDSSDDYESAKRHNLNFIYCSYGYGYLNGIDKDITVVNSSEELFSYLTKL
jgi:phosphoglycolate phosphatase